MDFAILITLPALAALLTIWISSVEKAVLSVYVPVLLLLPNYFYFGKPPLNFAEYAILPLGIAVCWKAFNGEWRWSLLDGLLAAFLVWNFLCDYHAIGWTDILQRIAVPATLALFPYMIGKMILVRERVKVIFMRRFVSFLFLDCLISTYEVRMGKNPARTMLIQFFPTTLWPGTVREGYVRAAGPFGHAILMGTIIAIAIILLRYVGYLGLWERPVRFLPLPVSKERLLLAGLIAGSLMTQSRGPWIAAIVGVVLASCGTRSDYVRAFKKAVVVLLIGGFLAFLVGRAYLSGPLLGDSEELRSAEYRTELISRYQDIALRQSLWGWGTNTWPKLVAMPSVDNAYLLIMLMYGFPGLIIYSLILLCSIIRLLRRALSGSELPARERALVFVLFAAVTTIALSILTVFLGEQLYPLLFLFLGWGEGCLTADRRELTAAAEPEIIEWQPKFQFPEIVT